MSQVHALSDDQVGRPPPAPGSLQPCTAPRQLRQQHQLTIIHMAGRRRAQEDDGLYPPRGHGEGQRDPSQG